MTPDEFRDHYFPKSSLSFDAIQLLRRLLQPAPELIQQLDTWETILRLGGDPGPSFVCTGDYEFVQIIPPTPNIVAYTIQLRKAGKGLSTVRTFDRNLVDVITYFGIQVTRK